MTSRAGTFLPRPRGADMRDCGVPLSTQGPSWGYFCPDIRAICQLVRRGIGWSMVNLIRHPNEMEHPLKERARFVLLAATSSQSVAYRGTSLMRTTPP